MRPDNTPRIDRGHINFWTGQITPAADINKLAGQGAVGNYTGHMIGSVFNNGAQYVAAGGVAATYNFGTQVGSFSVINYDGRSFTTMGKPITQGANYKFGIAGVPGIAGAVNGSFYGPMAAETAGNFRRKCGNGGNGVRVDFESRFRHARETKIAKSTLTPFPFPFRTQLTSSG